MDVPQDPIILVSFVDGFCKDEIMEKVLEFLYKIKPEEMPETARKSMTIRDSRR